MAPLRIIPSHAEVFDRLMRAKQSGRLGHSLLFTGGGGYGAYVVALRLAEQLLGLDTDAQWTTLFNHPDFLCISPLPPVSQRGKGTESGFDPVADSLMRDPFAPIEVGANWGITADQGRRVTQWAVMSPWQSTHKVALIAEFDRVNEATADIMLKTLEEPPNNVTIMLVTARPQDLLPTVRSRCHETRVPPLREEDIVTLLMERGTAEADARGIAPLAQGSLWQAITLRENDLNELRRDAAGMIVTTLDPTQKIADIMGDVRAIMSNLAPADVSEFVRWMIWWLRDLILAVEELQPVPEELVPALESAQKVGTVRLMQWLEEADRSYEMLSRNVTPEAVLTALTLFPRDQRRLGTNPTFPPLDVIVSHR